MTKLDATNAAALIANIPTHAVTDGEVKPLISAMISCGIKTGLAPLTALVEMVPFLIQHCRTSVDVYTHTIAALRSVGVLSESDSATVAEALALGWYSVREANCETLIAAACAA